MFGLDDIATALSAVSAVSGLFGGGASKSAAGSQVAGANNAINTLGGALQTVQGNAAPYQQIGENVLPSLLTGLGLPQSQAITKANFDAYAYLQANPDVAADPYFGTHPWEHYQMFGRTELATGGNNRHLGFAAPSIYSPQVGGQALGALTRPFSASDLIANLAPNWQFALQQGQGAAANALNMTGGMGGNYGKGLVDYTLNKSGDLYQQAFQNYTANQTNVFNRLASVAGLGQTANAQVAGAAVPIAQSVGQAQIGSGQATAAGTIGATNAITGGLQNAASWYALPSLLNAGNNGFGGVGAAPY